MKTAIKTTLALTLTTLAMTSGAALAAGSTTGAACLGRIGHPVGIIQTPLDAEVALAERSTAADALPLVSDALNRPGGLELLTRGWVLPRVYLAMHEPEIVGAALASALASTNPTLSRRAAHLMRVIGVAQPLAFAHLVARPELIDIGFEGLREELGAMPESDRRSTLLAIARHPTASAAGDD